MMVKNNLLYVIAILLNLFLSYAMLLYQQPFNVDGILYLNAAKIYLEQGLHAAMQIYPWPFYSLLIAKTSQLTHLSLLQSAFLLNGFFTSILVFSFLLLIKDLNGNIKHQCWGLALILLYPYLNHDRYNVLRDFGYYAFFLSSLWYFIAFLKTRKKHFGFLWQVMLILATTFRIEGALLLLFSPLIALFLPGRPLREKVFDLLKLSWVLLLLAGVTAIWFKSLWHFGRLPEIAADLHLDTLLPLLSQKITVIQEQVFSEPGRNEAGLFLTAGLTAIFFHLVIQTLGFPFTALFIYTLYTKSRHSYTKEYQGVFIYTAIVIFTLIGFLLHQLFLTGRYVVPLSLLFMLMLPFGLENLWEKKHWAFKAVAIYILLISTTTSFGHFGTSKTYLINAGEWASVNTPINANIYTNSAEFSYYASRKNTTYTLDFSTEQKNINNYNYIAILIHSDDKNLTAQQLFQIVGHAPLKIFQNNRHDKIYIFMIKEVQKP